MKRGRDSSHYKYVVYVRNISYKVTRDDIEKLLSSVGAIKHFKLFKDPSRSDKHRGRARCEYYDYDIMQSAIRNLDEYNIGGRTIYVGVDTSAVIPEIKEEEKEPKKAYVGTKLTDEEAKAGYQMLMAAKLFYEDDPKKFKRLCRENQETTFHLVQMSLLMGMNPGLIETAQELLAAETQK